MEQQDNTQTSLNSSWRVEAGRLLFFDKNERWMPLPATEVWRAAFGEGRNSCGMGSVVEALPEFEFSRFPAELGLEVVGQVPNNIQVTLVGIGGGNRAPLVAPDIDQVFIGNIWYPIHVEEYADVLTTLDHQGIIAGQIISVGQLIWLKTNASHLGITLFDSLQNSSPVNIHAPAAMNAGDWGLQANLYPYQRNGVYFLKLISDQGLGCILGDEMGLGKTIQIIALMLAEKSEGRSPSLVVAPATLLENWRRELTSFSPSLTVKVHAGPSRAGIIARLVGFDVVVTSYDIAVRDEPLLSSISWNLLVLDEAQSIKNPTAQRTLSVKSIPRRVSLAVTGTPVENRLVDLWSLSDFVLPGLLGDRNVFEQQFTDTNSDAADLAPIVAPILLRRRVRDVAKDLPERIDVAQPISMSYRMAQHYEQARLAVISEYGKSASLVELQRLRMFCAHPSLVGISPVDVLEDMPKYQRLLELLEEIFSHKEKCLIFTSYTAMIDIFLKDLPQRFTGQFFSFIDGRVPVEDRQPIVDNFFAASGGALILNPKAAGVGLNITTANHVIHYNPEWNPAVEDQASARAYRRKQQRPVTIHQMFFVDSIEEIVVERLAYKRGLAENAATGHRGEVTPSEVMRALSLSPLSRFGVLE